jgi:hypothetical protein
VLPKRQVIRVFSKRLLSALEGPVKRVSDLGLLLVSSVKAVGCAAKTPILSVDNLWDLGRVNAGLQTGNPAQPPSMGDFAS